MLLPRLCHPERSRMIRLRIILRSRGTWCSPGTSTGPKRNYLRQLHRRQFGARTPRCVRLRTTQAQDPSTPPSGGTDTPVWHGHYCVARIPLSASGSIVEERPFMAALKNDRERKRAFTPIRGTDNSSSCSRALSRSNCPTQAKVEPEWPTHPRFIKRTHPTNGRLHHQKLPKWLIR